jgi:dihydroorotate dehydrogenase electron transfer subunit
MRTITRVVEEAGGMKTLQFIDSDSSMADPGQYVMVWIPGLKEVPMSLSAIDEEGICSITVRPVGEATERLCILENGDRIGIRGPFGNGYKVEGDKPLLIAGGTGAASLTPLAYKLVNLGLEPSMVLGARSSDQLLFKEKLEKLLNGRLYISTDDGSEGYHGYASNYSSELLDKDSYNILYTCGPELMIASIYKEAEKRNLQIQASLERYIKCAVGVCGACAIGPFRVCKDGPVFQMEQLRLVANELGRIKMDPSGRVVRVDH